MDIPNYKKRIADKQVEEYLKLFGAVVIEGPKYCGKTWLGRYHAKSETMLYNETGMESKNINIARISPEIIMEGEKPKLIDEWQEATNLWDAIRNDVDRTGLRGQYILTGSSTPNREGILHSGAGRFGKIYLRPMSLYESGDSTGIISLKDICEGKKIAKANKKITLKKLAELVIRGGWPANINDTCENSQKKIKQYIKLIVDNDLYKLDGIERDKHKINLLLKSLARNESTTASNNTIINGILDNDNENVDKKTISSYLNALDKIFLIDNDEPYSLNVRSKIRLKQSEKRHFVDPSISCAILNLTVDKLISDPNTFGFMFESMVERDLKIYAEANDAKCYHYQDYNNNEIDLIMELNDGEWCAFEIKLGAYQVEEAAKKLINIKEKIKENGGKGPKILCVICGVIEAAYQREDGVYVIPITALKD